MAQCDTKMSRRFLSPTRPTKTGMYLPTSRATTSAYPTLTTPHHATPHYNYLLTTLPPLSFNLYLSFPFCLSPLSLPSRYLSPNLKSDHWRVPHEVKIPAKGSADLLVTYCRLAMCPGNLPPVLLLIPHCYYIPLEASPSLCVQVAYNSHYRLRTPTR